MNRIASGARIIAGLGLAATVVAAAGAAEGAKPAAAASACGMVKEFDQILKDRDAYPINVLVIDGTPRDHRDYAFPLPPGPHSFEIAERIPRDELSFQVQRSRDESIHKRKLTIDVQADHVYLIGARLMREEWTDPKAYWAPVILQEDGLPCKGK